jgi:NADH-quinone oxidoreductase subunit F
MADQAGFLLSGDPVHSVDDYLLDRGGGQGAARADELGPQGVIDEVTRAGLRGRGGAGFPTGRKWATVAGRPGTHTYVVMNAAEGEPGTFKDRALLRHNPYQAVEGLAVAALAVGAREAFIGIKASFAEETARLTQAIDEFRAAGFGEHLPITGGQGPDEYLFGEETALLEVVEGEAPLPRLLPPFEHGLFATAPQLGWSAKAREPGHEHEHRSNPTLVNNVETLANVAHILAKGADWFRGTGTEQSPGTICVTIVGDVARPAVGEVEMGTPFGEALERVAGGPRRGGRCKAAFSGVANPVLPAGRFDVPLSYEAMESAGTGLGAGGFIVYDDTACMVAVAHTFSRFLYVESCGQCPPCKLGSAEITGAHWTRESGRGTEDDLDLIAGRLRTVTDGNRCFLAVEERQVVASILQAFPDEVAAHLAGGCPRPRPIPLPKLVDLRDGRAVYDERQARKQPDWTYADVATTA